MLISRTRHMWLGGTARVSIVAAALTLHASIAAAQSNIGKAASVKNQVEGLLEGQQARHLSSGNAVHSSELIRSGDAAVAELVFIDQTKVSVGPKSEIRLDKFVYNPNKGSGAVVLETSRGAYRFITGVQEHKNYEIKTPYATLGVRGTIIEINLEGIEEQDQNKPADDPCRNYERIKLVEGAFEATTISGRTALVTEPDTVLTVCSDGSFQTTKLAQSILNFKPQDFAATPTTEPGPPRPGPGPGPGPGPVQVVGPPPPPPAPDLGLASLAATIATFAILFGDHSGSNPPPMLPASAH
jgi:hypothetical protein